MKPTIVAAVTARERNFFPIPDSIVQMTNIRDADLFDVKLEPDGSIRFKRVEEGSER